MSVVVHYIRLSPKQLALFADNPEALWTLDREQRVRRMEHYGAEMLDLGTAYEVIAWLLSPLKRLEVDHLDRLIRDPTETDQAVRARIQVLDATPADPLLEAVEGRGAVRDERFDIGLGAPAVLPPEKVTALNAAFAKLGRADLERAFDADEMERVELPPVAWRKEGRSIMETYVLPSFARLQAFYRAAAAGNQVVMIFLT
jgi:hypothetical protein